MFMQRLKEWLTSLSRHSQRDTSSPASRVIVVSPTSLAVRYVDALLSDLAERQSKVTLQASERLPAVDGMTDDPPSFNQAVNRLKFLAGLNPIAHPKPISGRFTWTLRGRRYEVTAEFDDRGQAPHCRVSVRGPLTKNAAASRES
jgi:hypothetical protein